MLFTDQNEMLPSSAGHAVLWIGVKEGFYWK